MISSATWKYLSRPSGRLVSCRKAITILLFVLFSVMLLLATTEIPIRGFNKFDAVFLVVIFCILCLITIDYSSHQKNTCPSISSLMILLSLSVLLGCVLYLDAYFHCLMLTQGCFLFRFPFSLWVLVL